MNDTKLQQLVYFQWVIIILIMAACFAITAGIRASNEIKQIRSEYQMRMDSLERRHAEMDFQRAQAFIQRRNEDFRALAKLSHSNAELSQKLKSAKADISKSATRITLLESRILELEKPMNPDPYFWIEWDNIGLVPDLHVSKQVRS